MDEHIGWLDIYETEENDVMKKTKITNGILMVSYVLCCIVLLSFWGRKVLPIYHETVRTRIYLCIPLVLMILIVGYFCYLILKKKKVAYEKIFLITALIWGVVFCMIIPLAVCADGHFHLGTSYSASNYIMGYTEEDYIQDDTMEQTSCGTYVRLEDTAQRNLTVLTTASYVDAAESNWFGAADDGALYYRNDGTYWNGEESQYIRYPFAALGMALGRVLRLGQTGIIYLAKCFNIMAFSLIGYVCVKILPIGKAQMINIAMIPMVLETYSSLHYDNFLIELIMLFVSLCLYYAYREADLRIWDIMLLAVIWILMIPNKFIFALNALFLLIIPMKKYKHFWENKKRIGTLIGLILLMGGGVLWKYGRGIISYLTIGGGTNTYNLMYCFQNPMKVIRIFINSFGLTHIYKEICHMMGGWIGHQQFMLSSVPLLIIFGLVILSIFVCEGKRLSKKNMILSVAIIAIIFLVEWLMILGRRTTDVTEMPLFLFGRYLMAVFIMFPVLLGSDAKGNTKVLYVYYAQSIMLMAVVCNILYVVITEYNVLA